MQGPTRSLEHMCDPNAPWARLAALALILKRASGKPDQRVLLDEGHANSITICFV